MSPEINNVPIFDNIRITSVQRPNHLDLIETVESLKQSIDDYMGNLKAEGDEQPIELSKDEHVITSVEEEEEWREERMITEMKCDVEKRKGSKELTLKLLLRLEDSMNRQLIKNISEKQNGMELAMDLVYYGLINKNDQSKVATIIQNGIDNPSVS